MSQLSFSCNASGLCDLTFTMPTMEDPSYIYEASANLGGKVANFLLGGLTFSGSVFIAPTTPAGTTLAFQNIPVTVQGTLTGYDVVSQGTLPTSPLWSLLIEGTGTLNSLQGIFEPGSFCSSAGGCGLYGYSNYSFTGTASPVPEPSLLLLVGAGLASIAFLLKRARFDIE